MKVVRLGAVVLALAAGCGSSASSTDASSDASSATDGASADGDAGACACFAHGVWQIDNLSPCFFTDAPATTVTAATSSVQDSQLVSCPSDHAAAPAQPWSTDRLTADCAGHYRLCYTLKGGDANAPKASDCIVAQSCAVSDYTTPNVAQTWPPLPSWITTGAQASCAQLMQTTGGYGEMTVTGTATGCGEITKTLARVTYCPLSCNADPSCGCMAGGGGAF